jgi:hypothetical protein
LTLPEPAAFSSALEKLFRDLHTRWLELAPDEIVITDERLRQELALPVGRHGRICYFALPAILVSFYRDTVFPLADHAGLVAATGDETLGRGGTLRAMIDMLLSRADVVIADVSTGDRRVRREFRAARRRVPPPEVAVISDNMAEESTQPATPVFVRPSTRFVEGTQGSPVGVADSTSWVQPLGVWLDTVGANVMNRLVGQLRQLDASRDRTAVITAANALEITLQRTLAARGTGRARTTAIAGSRLTVLIHQALERKMLSVDDANQAGQLQEARTATVHGQGAPDAAAAKALIERAIEIIHRLIREAAPPNANPRPKRRRPG